LLGGKSNNLVTKRAGRKDSFAEGPTRTLSLSPGVRNLPGLFIRKGRESFWEVKKVP